MNGKRITILEWANMPEPRPNIKHPYNATLAYWFGETIFYDKNVSIHDEYVNVLTLCSGVAWAEVRSFKHSTVVEIIGENEMNESTSNDNVTIYDYNGKKYAFRAEVETSNGIRFFVNFQQFSAYVCEVAPLTVESGYTGTSALDLPSDHIAHEPRNVIYMARSYNYTLQQEYTSLGFKTYTWRVHVIAWLEPLNV
jgi:hypothetical protein